MKLFSIIILLASSPILLLISLFIYIESRTGVIFKQVRIGLHKKEFVIYKFKTMENNKVTFIGKFLRKLGLDEIPQLINVIYGQMNFIGPRPLTKFDIDRLGWDEDKFSKRWEVKPGITGAAQVRGFRGETKELCDMEGRVKWDVWYIENWNLLLDLNIIFKTVFNIFKGDEKAF